MIVRLDYIRWALKNGRFWVQDSHIKCTFSLVSRVISCCDFDLRLAKREFTSRCYTIGNIHFSCAIVCCRGSIGCNLIVRLDYIRWALKNGWLRVQDSYIKCTFSLVSRAISCCDFDSRLAKREFTSGGYTIGNIHFCTAVITSYSNKSSYLVIDLWNIRRTTKNWCLSVYKCNIKRTLGLIPRAICRSRTYSCFPWWEITPWSYAVLNFRFCNTIIGCCGNKTYFWAVCLYNICRACYSRLLGIWNCYTKCALDVNFWIIMGSL